MLFLPNGTECGSSCNDRYYNENDVKSIRKTGRCVACEKNYQYKKVWKNKKAK